MTQKKQVVPIREIALGSKSGVKREALTYAMAKMGLHSTRVICVGTESGVNEQPVGIVETSIGSRMRAVTARMARPQAIGIGIESGILVSKPNPAMETLLVQDFAHVTVISSDGSHRATSTSVMFHFPTEFYLKALKIGFDKTTVGKMIAEELGCPHDNPHLGFFNGKVSRVHLIGDTIEIALLKLQDS